MKQTKRQRAQCAMLCKLMAGTKQQCEIWRSAKNSDVSLGLGVASAKRSDVLFDSELIRLASGILERNVISPFRPF